VPNLRGEKFPGSESNRSIGDPLNLRTIPPMTASRGLVVLPVGPGIWLTPIQKAASYL